VTVFRGVLKPWKQACASHVWHSIYDFDVTLLILIVKGKYMEDSGVPGHDAVSLDEFFPRFRMKVVPASSGVKQFKKNSRNTYV
jgi:hypothetical protein